MARFHDLTVTAMRKTTRDAVEVTLSPSSGDFGFQPGQYLTFRRNFEGTEIRRSYSICAGLTDPALKVGIKRVQGGAFSTWANTELQVGDTVQAMEPMGQFHIPLDASSQHHYLGFAGGSGITPVLSILRSVLAYEPQSRFTLIYANRAVSTIMFRDQIEDLKNKYMGRLTVVHILEGDGQDTNLFSGQLTTRKCADLFSNWVDVTTVDQALICGPEPMMLTIVDSLKMHGMDASQIKFELFASGQPGQLPQKHSDIKTSHDMEPVELRVVLDGATHTLEMSRDQSLLQAALGSEIDAPYACTAGVCSTCKCKVLEGRVEMATNHALEDDEVALGYVLSCQSYAISDTVVVDYDQ